jgi:hypothetical protein
MSWIKMRTDLWDDPRVSAICDKLDATEATIIGALFRFWSIADQHSVDGLLAAMTPSSLDRKVGLSGFAKALEQVGWLAVDSDGLRVPRFHEHNGESAKTRARNAKNQSHRRSVTDLSPESGDGTVMPRVPTEESEKESETETEGFAEISKPEWPELDAFAATETPQSADIDAASVWDALKTPEKLRDAQAVYRWHRWQLSMPRPALGPERSWQVLVLALGLKITNPKSSRAKNPKGVWVSAICKSRFEQARAFVPQAIELLTPVWADADNQGGQS